MATSRFNLRVKALSVVFVVAMLATSARLFYWQVVRGQGLATLGYRQQQSVQKVLAKRGSILSSDGTWLTASSEAWLVYVERPGFKEKPEMAAEMLAPLLTKEITTDTDDPEYTKKLMEEALEKEEERIKGLLSNESLVWIPLKDRVDRRLREEIEKLGIEGLGFEQDEARAYPEASSAAHVLGFVGKDDTGADKGYFGLEGYYDSSLAGKHGFKSGETNALGAPIIFGASREGAVIQGVDLVSHIDKAVQLIIEKHLKDGLERYGAASGSIVVTRPKDGSIIAMASEPSYDPDKYYNFSDELFRNPVISDGFEPGSIFKPIVMASALDAGLVTPSTLCDICDEAYRLDKYLIRTWNDEYNPGSTMRDVIVHSDNVGMVFVGEKLGADELHDYLSEFGFGRLTGVDLQGEVTPNLRERGTWNIVDLATASFGQGIAVTPIQMVKAISTIANGGKEVVPQVVDKIQVAGEVEDLSSVYGKQVISSEAAAQTVDMMVAAVVDGEAKWAVPEGFTIAGKTGTAQIPVAGHYDSEKTIASFVGFAPPYDPEFMMLITLREPQSSPWASETAAPLWFDIAKELFPYLGIQPDK
jgi:cell division protein FtsI/penicillin-binding protein 2